MEGDYTSHFIVEPGTSKSAGDCEKQFVLGVSKPGESVLDRDSPEAASSPSSFTDYTCTRASASLWLRTSFLTVSCDFIDANS
jgi:hypothetical protein